MAAQPTLMTGGTTAIGARGPWFLRAGEWAGAVVAYLVVSPLSALSTRAVRRTLLAIICLNLSFEIEKHFFIRADPRDLGSLGGLRVSLTNISLAILYVAWFVKGALHRAPAAAMPALRHTPGIVPATLLLGIYVLSCLVAADRVLASFEVASVLEQYLLYLFIARTVTSREEVAFIVRVLLMGLILQSALMLAQVAGLVGDIDTYGFKARADFAGDSRISGTLGSPNPAAAYLAIMMVLALGVLFSRVRRLDRCLAALGLAAAAVPLLFTLSRGGWLLLVVGASLLGMFARGRGARIAVASAVVLVTLLVVPFSGVITDRLSGDDNGSAEDRMPLNYLAMSMIADHPVLGVGANNFAVAMQPYLAKGFTGGFVYTVHNKYLLVCAETGAVGLIAFLWFLLSIVRSARRISTMRDALLSPLALGCMAALVGLIVQLNFEPARTGPEVDLIWVIGGLVGAMSGATRRPPSRGDLRQHAPASPGLPRTTLA
jgi:O-antigen ligase